MALKTGKGAEAPPFIVMDVIAAANAKAAAAAPGDPRVIRMEVGQPSTGAPDAAVEAAIAAMRAGETLGRTRLGSIEQPRHEGAVRGFGHRPCSDAWPVSGAGRASDARTARRP